MEQISALVTVKHLLQKNIKCRNLLENDAGGGSVAGAIAVSPLFSTLWKYLTWNGLDYDGKKRRVFEY